MLAAGHPEGTRSGIDAGRTARRLGGVEGMGVRTVRRKAGPMVRTDSAAGGGLDPVQADSAEISYATARTTVRRVCVPIDADVLGRRRATVTRRILR